MLFNIHDYWRAVATAARLTVLTMHLYTGSMRQHAEVFEQACLDLVNVVGCVLVGHV